MDIDEASDELYSVAPEEFTALRDSLVKRARAGGDRALATAVAALRRPTVSAYLANRLAREHQTEVAALAELGALLHQATSGLDGAALRELSRQRSQLIAALVAQVRTLAEAEGRRFSDDTRRDLEDTVRAAIGDVGAAQVLTAGRLVEPLRPGMSFPVNPVTDSPVRPPPAPKRRAAAVRGTDEGGGAPDLGAQRRLDRERAEAAAAIADLEAREGEARAASRAASESAVLAAEDAQRAADEVGRLREALEAAIAIAQSSDDVRRAAVVAAEEAEGSVAAAARLADEARERLAGLTEQ